MEKDNELVLLQFGAEDFLPEITAAVTNGRPCLVEDVEEQIDITIDPILMKKAFKTDARQQQKTTFGGSPNRCRLTTNV